jgi:hypothetical protein
MSAEQHITVAEAARAEGVTKQVLHRQVRTGLVRSHVLPDGRRMVLLSEVRHDRRANLMPAHRWRHQREKAARTKRQARIVMGRAPGTVPVYANDGTVIAHVSIADVIAEHGSAEALRQAADADGHVPVMLVRVSEIVEDFALLTEEALANTDSDAIHLTHLDVTASRADAEQLLAAYRSGADVRELHRRLGVRAD